MKICVVCLDEHNKPVAGVIDLVKNKVAVVDYITLDQDTEDSSLQIIESCEFVLYADLKSTGIVQRLKLPAISKGTDIKSLLNMELSTLVPVAADDILWGYRVTEENKDANIISVMLHAVTKTAFESVVEKLKSISLKIDAYLYLPSILSSDIFPELKNYESPLDNESFQYQFSSLFEKPFNDFLRTLPENAQGRDEVNSILFLVIEYLKRKGIEKSLLESKKMIPDYMKPRRHRFLKNLYWLTAAASIVIAVTFGIRHSSKSYAEYSNLKSYNSRLETELTSLKKEHAILLKKETQLKKLLESTPGCPHILHILSDMTRKIPSYMWVTSFNSSGDILNITLSSDKDSTDSYRQLSSAKSFEVINLRKRKTYNKKFAYYIKLRSKLNNEL